MWRALYRHISKNIKRSKKNERLKGSGHLLAFRYRDFDWPLNPQTVFYDWLYLSALQENYDLVSQLHKYDGFSDIEFNPNKSINYQAAAAALYKALVEKRLFELAMSSPTEFIKFHAGQKAKLVPVQPGLF